MFNCLNFYDIKKLLFLSAFCLFAFTIFLFSCKREAHNPVNNSDNSLLLTATSFQNDSTFLNFVHKWIDQSFKVNNVSLIEEIVSDHLISSEEQLPLAIAMGFKSYSEYEDFVLSILNDYKYLNEVYDFMNLPSSVIESSIYTVAEAYILEIFLESIPNEPKSSIMSCASNYALCVASVTAAAATGHIACAGADLFPPVGILCHASIIALQMVGNADCTDNYNACVGN